MRVARSGAMERYLTLADLLGCIRPTNRSRCEKLLADHAMILGAARGSSANHQTWDGGYIDHVVEAMNLAVVFFESMDRLRSLPFRLHEALLVLFLHDIEKPWKVRAGLTDKAARKAFRWGMIEAYGFELTAMQRNALEYVEGEGEDYSPHHRVMNELAAFCHLCDTASARIWWDKGREENW